MSTSAERKSYVVFNGRKPGVYTSWIDCYAQVHGFKDSVVRLYDTLDQGGSAWSSYGSLHKFSLLRKHQIEGAINDNYGISCEILNSIDDTSADYVDDHSSTEILFGHNIEEWLKKACHYMRIEQPLFTFHNLKEINGKRHYRYRASVQHKSIGKPPVSLGRYARTVERACEDAAVSLLRRLLSSNGFKIKDYNLFNVDLLESKLQKALNDNLELRMENAALTAELQFFYNNFSKK